MGDKKSEYEEALEHLDGGEQPLAHIEGSREDEGTAGVLIATDKRLFWFDRQMFGMKTKKFYSYGDFAGIKEESESMERTEIEFKPKTQGFLGTGTKSELEIEHIKSPAEQRVQFVAVCKQKIAEAQG